MGGLVIIIIVSDCRCIHFFPLFLFPLIARRGEWVGLGSRVGGNGSFRFLFSFFPFLGGKREKGRKRRRQ